jgi:tRNA(His) guanylyltransferase
MKFDDLDARMRVYESTCDPTVLPGLYMVARVDGRGFTRLVRELHDFEAPFDTRFRDYMTATAAHLMDCGFDALFGFTQSDEISILLDAGSQTFGRKLRKIQSVLAGEASALFTSRLGAPAAFDCRVAQLPGQDLVVDYFLWRQADGARNALNAHCYWLLRKNGASARAATQQLSGMATAAKNELLFQQGINFNDLPAWQKRGIGLYTETWLKLGRNPKTGATTEATRTRIKIDDELPMKEDFAAFLRARLQQAASA